MSIELDLKNSKFLHVYDSEDSQYELIVKEALLNRDTHEFVYLAESYDNFDFEIGTDKDNFTFVSKFKLDKSLINSLIITHTNNNLTSFLFNIKSNNIEIDNSLKHINSFLSKTIKKIDKDKLFKIGVVYRELVTNAIRYANKGDNSKFVWIEILVNVSKKIVTLMIDDGDYEFNLKKYSETVEDITDLRTDQRGIFLIKQLSDEIIDNKKKIVRFKL
ncbi:MAG: ATP-binding protein [Candidatus Cloacimonadota bacterium]|nr:ATP-binding protein [Candidatus Cloacimonadota bacterium]